MALVLGFLFAGPKRLGVSAQESADSKPASLDSIIDMNLTDATLLLALSKLAVDYHVPIGFEHAVDSEINPN